MPAGAATDPGTWRHCLMWKLTAHHLRALGASSTPADIWEAGTLHMATHAPLGASRRASRPAADDFGETRALILDYAGPAIATFMTLRSAEASLRGPVRAALAVAGQAPSDQRCRNALRPILHDGFLNDLPPALRIIDQQQRGILTAMGDSDAPAHVIHALAGCGKSTLLQCLVTLLSLIHI